MEDFIDRNSEASDKYFCNVDVYRLIVYRCVKHYSTLRLRYLYRCKTHGNQLTTAMFDHLLQLAVLVPNIQMPITLQILNELGGCE